MKTFTVQLKREPAAYRIVTGWEIFSGLAGQLKKSLVGGRVLVVTNPVVNRHYGRAVNRALAAAGQKVATLVLPAGERHKNLASFSRIIDAAIRARLDRSDAIVALGGGVIGDLAGYAAASLYRGVRLVQIPTTIVAQQDSSIGGKVGCDVPQGKNLVGAFHQPVLVATEVRTLLTLPPVEFRNGMAEVIKHGVIRDQRLFAFLQRSVAKIAAREPAALCRMINDAIMVKVGVVQCDEREAGLRAILNYGHTVGHALEAMGGYRALRHGEAIAIGMEVAARLAWLRGTLPAEAARTQREVLRAYGLPVTPPPVDFDRLWEFLLRDKKVRAGKVRFVLPRRLGAVEVTGDVDRRLLRAAWRTAP